MSTPPVLRPQFAADLDAPGLPFIGASGVGLADVYVPPHLTLRASSQHPPDALAAAVEAPHLLVAGARRIGRTALARRLVATLHDAGVPALLATGHDFRDHDPDAIEAEAQRLTVEQCAEGRVRPSVLVVDDLDLARAVGRDGVKGLGRRAFLRAVERRFDRVVALTTDHGFSASGPLSPGAPTYVHASLASFDAGQRADLAAKFADALVPQDEWHTFVGQARRLLDALFSDGRLPAFPYYLLVALGELHDGHPAHISDHGYGHYYEVVVHEAAQAVRALGRTPRRDAVR